LALAPHSSNVCISGCMFSSRVSRYAGATLNLSSPPAVLFHFSLGYSYSNTFHPPAKYKVK